MLCVGGVVDPVFEQAFIDVNSHHLTKDHPGGDLLA
jgi:hypothetical protein